MQFHVAVYHHQNGIIRFSVSASLMLPMTTTAAQFCISLMRHKMVTPTSYPYKHVNRLLHLLSSPSMAWNPMMDWIDSLELSSLLDSRF